MSLVFLSHADADKLKLRYIADALIAAGFKVWLDNPLAMGFSEPEIKAHFYQLEGGAKFREQIDAGLREASAVLVCWSEHAKADRKVWHAEATVARTLQKLVACRIDDVNPTELPDGHGTEQLPDLRVDDAPADGDAGWLRPKRVPRNPDKVATAVALLIAAIKAKVADAAVRGMARRVQARTQRDVFAPFLIDRVDQEGAIVRAIDHVNEHGGVRPALIAGPENECLDEFLVRLRTYRNRKRLSDQAWYEVKVEWPGRSEPGRFELDYRTRLAVELGLPSTAKEEAVAGAIAQKGRTVAVVCLMRAQEWQPGEPKRVEAWLKWWEALAGGPIRIAAIPILSVKMPKVKPAWKDCPGGCAEGGTVSNADIWRAARSFTGQGGGSIFALFGRRKVVATTLDVPPILHPVGIGDVDRWLDDHIEMMSSDREKAMTERDKLFDGKAAVALEDFARAMKPLFGTPS